MVSWVVSWCHEIETELIEAWVKLYSFELLTTAEKHYLFHSADKLCLLFRTSDCKGPWQDLQAFHLKPLLDFRLALP